jgi:hypothetical protein
MEAIKIIAASIRDPEEIMREKIARREAQTVAPRLNAAARVALLDAAASTGPPMTMAYLEAGIELLAEERERGGQQTGAR